ncbi:MULTISPECIES: hypothetical protein [Salinicola]|uniref:Uncharacterized protein n=1 Tax=Salinicola lusitanus TaxID=1949085 RepID=A0ABZ3CP65_9GAMM|nr:hypothetical protein [Salinicola sp. MIT1003]OHZ00153.1 hypothetical protein BC443_10360 [Salinicola sp. MIT1003]
MPNFFTIKDGWSLDEQLGNMLRELDDAQETGRVVEFRVRLKALMRECDIGTETVVDWIDLGILKDERD